MIKAVIFCVDLPYPRPACTVSTPCRRRCRFHKAGGLETNDAAALGDQGEPYPLVMHVSWRRIATNFYYEGLITPGGVFPPGRC